MKKFILLSIALILLSCSKPAKVLIFSKTAGFRHKSIEAGVETIKQLGKQHDFFVEHTEDSLKFTPEYLKQYDLVIFLNTTGDILNGEQQKNFENYIKNGGSFLGVHAAADTEYDWPWYGKLVGAYFKNHPKQQEASLEVLVADHPSTAHLSNRWVHFDEWYNYRNINPDLNVLINLDESTYQGGENGKNHPIAWFHEFDGGKGFCTGLGHTDAAYNDENFKKHLLGGIYYCLNK